MSSIQNLFTSRDNNANSSTYVGQQDRLWYDAVLGFRVSDGNTPGGTPAVVAVTSANIGNLTIANTTISTVQTDANINIVTNGVGNITLQGAFVTANTAGNIIIETLQNGTVNFYVPNISYDSAIDIIGTADGTQLFPQNQGVLLHLTGQDSLPARVYSDGVNNYAAFIGRRYNGNATVPTQVLSGQVIARLGGTPYSNVGWPAISTARVDFVALENQTGANRGTSIEFYTTPVGTGTAVPSITVASTGITNAANVIPISDQAYNLGTLTNRWKNVYAGQGGLWLADSITNVETQLSVNAGTFYINGVQSIALGNLVISNTTLETATANTNISIGNVADTGYLAIERTTQINTQNLGNSAALLINGTLSALVPTEYTNTMFHTVAVPGYNSIHLSDAFGNTGATNYFPTYEGRAARGNVTNPSATQNGDVLMRVAAAGYGTNTFDTALGTQGGSRIDFRATENYTNTAKGSDIHFWTTQPGTTSTVNSGSIDHQGFSGNSFKFTTDNSVQTTAGIPLTQKANALGVASLDSSGYLAAAQIPPSLTGGLVYKGSWDASTNTPTLANGSGTQGFEYSIGTTGTQNLGGGSVVYQQGGFVIYGSGVWNYVPPSGLFTSLTANTHLSVNQPTGAITITVDATSSLVNSAIVSRDANGSFAANIITATLSGAATSAGTAGTVTSNIQSAITQVGTLTVLAVSGNVTGGNILTAGAMSSTGNVTGGNILTAGAMSSTGNVTHGNILTAGVISAAGNITSGSGSFFIGNGSQLTGIVSSYGNANVVANLAALGSNPVSTTGNVIANYFIGNGSALTSLAGANVTGTVANSTYAVSSGSATTAGTVTTNAQPNITSVGTLTSLSITGNVTGGNVLTGGLISATGNITGNYFIGNGSQLTGIVSSYGNANVNTLLSAWGSNALSTTGNITAAYHIGNGSFLTSLIGANVTGTVANATYAVTSGSATTAGTVTTNAQPNITSVGILSSVSITGNIDAGNLRTAGQVSATGNITGSNLSGTLTTASQTNITSVGTLTSLSVTGNTTSGNILTGGSVSSTGNITGNYFIGNGSQLTGLPATYGNSNVNTLLAAWGSNTVSTTGTITAGNITGGNLLTAGIQSSTGNVIGGNVLTGGLISATGNITGGNVTAARFTGNLVGSASNLVTNTSSTAGTFLTGQVNIPAQTIAKNTTSVDVTVTVTGLTTSHKLVVTPAADLNSGIFVSAAYPSSANTLGIQMQNTTGGAITTSAFNLTYMAWV